MKKLTIVKELIRERLDPIVLLEYYGVNITDRGHRYNKVRCSCPIHSGDNPTGFSFDLNTKQFTCFTSHCGESPKDWFFIPKDNNMVPRDVFMFIKLMEEERTGNPCSFPRAVEIASQLCGIPIDDETSAYNKEMIDKLDNQKWVRQMAKLTHEVELEEFSEEDIEIFKAQLPLCDYVYTRGFSDDILEFFGIGFSPEGVDEPWHAKKRDFCGRMIFPIRDDAGRLVGWSGRLATDDKALAKKFNKYMHKMDFDKGFVLYNYDNAKDFIKAEKELVLVEGPFDVMRLWSYGICNVVAIQGSSLTPEQLSLAISSTMKVKVFLDSDGAGQSGARRICEQLKHYVDVYVVEAPDNKDPDECQFDEAWSAILDAKKYISEPIPQRKKI